jgi:phospholipid/cholesterol/gamma-HCH transport system permease protein
MSSSMDTKPTTHGAQPGCFNISGSAKELTIAFSGDWRMQPDLPLGSTILDALQDSPTPATIILTDDAMTHWDTGLIIAVAAIRRWCTQESIVYNGSNIPEGARRLVELACTVSAREGAARTEQTAPRVERVGMRTLNALQDMREGVTFVGEVILSFGRFFSGTARYRKRELWLTIGKCGPEALGIVATISLLVGAILAFVGAIQLKMFGAEVYVANLVAVGMVIEMGALMTGIILAGRTGAAFAAQLGTMEVNEEIDALRTLGISPIDYLVLPRIIALVLMTPLLVVFADLIGIVGGGLVAIFVLDLSPTLYINQTINGLQLWYCTQGLIKGGTFGILIAIIGCLRGMQCGRSASAVGDAATSAVVSSIVAIVLADALWTFIFMFSS